MQASILEKRIETTEYAGFVKQSINITENISKVNITEEI